MGDGNINTTPKNVSLMPVSALSAECKLRDILLRKGKIENRNYCTVGVVPKIFFEPDPNL